MDKVFRFLVNEVALSLNDAAQLCSTTPASELGLRDTGTLSKGAIADLVVMDRDLNVKQTYVADGWCIQRCRPTRVSAAAADARVSQTKNSPPKAAAALGHGRRTPVVVPISRSADL